MHNLKIADVTSYALGVTSDGTFYSSASATNFCLGHGDPHTELSPRPLQWFGREGKHVVCVSPGDEHVVYAWGKCEKDGNRPIMIEELAFERYKADIRATNILLQGIPKDIYSLINHYTDAKDIWENMKMILEGSELTKDDRNLSYKMSLNTSVKSKEKTFKDTTMQLNSKFVNNMLPEWSRFITEVKLNRGLKESNCDQLYAYLKQHEVHANENRIMMERFGQPNNDPLALVSDASVQQYPTQSSKSPQSSTEPSPADHFQLDSGSPSTENLIESLSNTLSLLTQSYKSHLPQTNNQLRASSNARNKAMVQDGKVVVQDVRGRYNATN
ncbi:integrase, catalytic region, zinc finger, CCHC-type containing protein [Tanacetum coccineum]